MPILLREESFVLSPTPEMLCVSQLSDPFNVYRAMHEGSKQQLNRIKI